MSCSLWSLTTINQTKMNRNQQLGYGALLPLLCATAGALALWGPWIAQLPDPVAIQWGLDGKGGNCIPISLFRALFSLLILVLAARQAHLFGVLGSQAPDAATRSHVSNTGLLCAITLGTVLTVYNNFGATTCRASTLSWPFLAITIAVPLLLSRHVRSLVQESPSVKGPSMGLSPQDHAVWVQQVSSPAIVGIGVIASLITAFQGSIDSWATWLVAGFSFAASLCLGWIRVHAGPRGLEVYYGPIPFPLTRISLAEIRSARAETMSPGSSGGWGYRGILSLTGRAAIFLRSGEGLLLDLTRDRRFSISIDDASSAAGLLNDLIARRAE